MHVHRDRRRDAAHGPPCHAFGRPRRAASGVAPLVRATSPTFAAFLPGGYPRTIPVSQIGRKPL
jgi:hypothetical protein